MTLPELAKLSVETYLKEGKIIEPPADLSEEFLQKKSGVFVTIEENGKLRGCIGTYLPTKINIAEEIIHNAIAAAIEDYRFDSIDEKELSSLTYTVYILNDPEPLKNIKTLNPRKFGIIVKTTLSPVKTGLLLPDLDGVNTVEQQIQICCQKGGIDKEKEKFIIFCFTVKKHDDK